MAISLDVLLASLILLGVFVTGIVAYIDYISSSITYQQYVSCLSKAILYSDILIYRELSDGRWSVDCKKVPLAYAKLSALGFEGKISCDSFSAGEDKKYRVVLHRKAYWKDKGRIVDVNVELC